MHYLNFLLQETFSVDWLSLTKQLDWVLVYGRLRPARLPGHTSRVCEHVRKTDIEWPVCRQYNRCKFSYIDYKGIGLHSLRVEWIKDWFAVNQVRCYVNKSFHMVDRCKCILIFTQDDLVSSHWTVFIKRALRSSS